MKLNSHTTKFAFLVLLALFVFAQPKPAHAQMATIDAAAIGNMIEENAKTAIQWAKEAAQWAAEAIQWATSNLLTSSGFSSVNNGFQILSKHEEKTTQAVIDGNKLANETAIVANRAADAVLPANSEACATMALGQMHTQARAATNALGAAMINQDNNKDTAPGADARSPAAASENIKDLCDLGFLSQDPNDPYGKMATALHCQTDAAYTNAFRDISRLTDKMQYPVPVNGHVKISASKHVLFAGSTGTEKDFAAAYKFCEYLMPPAPAYHNTLATIAGISAADANNRYNIMRSMAIKTCRTAIGNRTACPAGASDSVKNVGGAGNCSDIQKELCTKLTAPLPTGLGLSMSHDPEMGAVLANCQTQGISEFMYEKIRAHRCDDKNYMVNVGTNSGKADKLKEVQAACDKDVDAFEAKLDAESDRLQQSIPNMVNLRGMATDTSPLDQPVAK